MGFPLLFGACRGSVTGEVQDLNGGAIASPEGQLCCEHYLAGLRCFNAPTDSAGKLRFTLRLSDDEQRQVRHCQFTYRAKPAAAPIPCQVDFKPSPDSWTSGFSAAAHCAAEVAREDRRSAQREDKPLAPPPSAGAADLDSAGAAGSAR